MEPVKNIFFSHQYFYALLQNKGFKSRLWIARKEGEIVAGAIFTITNNIMKYHLADTTNNHFKERMMKLIIDETRLLENELELDFLHLIVNFVGNDGDS